MSNPTLPRAEDSEPGTSTGPEPATGTGGTRGSRPDLRLIGGMPRSWRRQLSVSRSQRRRARAPPRRQAVSVCRRSRRASRMTSLPVARAAVLIWSSSCGVKARRVLGSRRGFGDAVRWAGAGGDEVVGDRAGVDGAGSGDDVLAGVPAAAAVTPQSRCRGRLVLHGFDIGGGDLVQAAIAPSGEHALPVAAIGAACAWPGRCDHPGQVGSQCGDGGTGVGGVVVA
jgi:hypothetical protein